MTRAITARIYISNIDPFAMIVPRTIPRDERPNRRMATVCLTTIASWNHLIPSRTQK